ncbi:MAG: ABC-F family ATP-binding cassette domain-containing protein, partial [Eubacteriales bacterium]|nr:ABC-F family ATP-binding cassette domain-containing protein [Eubacteriales bacterium]
MIVAVEQICKEYSAQPVLENIDIQVKRGQKIGLVGANGSGKTTLLRIVAGELEADSGRVMLAKGCKIGYQSQKLVFAPGSTVLEEGLSVFANLAAMEQQLRQLEEQLSEGDELVLNQYAHLSHEFEELGGYSYPARTRGILRGLGFSEAEFAQLVDSLSGGQQSRLALAKLLLSDPDLLLLDEPTNHLDIAAINWLEGYLKGFRGGLLMVSHDRRFLENLADTIGELENTRLVVYPGNYRFFLKERKLRREKLLKNYLAQQEYIKRTEDFIARNIEGQNTKQAQSRRRDLEKLVRLETPPAQIPRASFKFDQRRPSGRHVLQCHNLAKSFAGKNIFHNASFQLERGDRTGLIGPNGCGKTTLLELICGLQQPDAGSVSFGHYVELAYYSQMRGDLEGKNSAAEEIWSVRPAWTRGEVQNFLARFLFRGEDAFKLVKFMSGGEASRLALAKLLLSRANFLILDEPTNHLDLDSREVLEDALNQFPGTILIVSHDRWFLNAVTNITLEMNSEGIERFQGSYDYWLAKKEARELEAIPPVPPVKPESKETVAAKLSPNEIYRRQQRLAQLEAEVARAEDRQTQLSLELTDPQVGHEKLHQL